MSGAPGCIPRCLSAEASVLGGVLLRNERLTDIGYLVADDFYDPKHREVFAAMKAVEARSRAIDPVTLEEQLEQTGKLKAIGGLSFLADLATMVPTADNITHYADIVKEKSAARRLIVTASDVVTRACREDLTAEERRALSDELHNALASGSAVSPGAIGSTWRAIDPRTLMEAPPPRSWLLRHPTLDGKLCPPCHGDGLLPLGKAAILASAGGVGKTNGLIALAVAVVTGRRWLGHFEIDYPARRGRVFLGLAEEDAEEIHRRLYAVAQQYELTPDERRRVADQVIALPLAGHSVALVGYGADGRSPTITPELAELRRRLDTEAGEHGWSLVALDPLARFAGPDVEADNSVATRFIQALESLTAAPGKPLVIAAHHSSKLARRAGDVDARGVTGLTDAVRWVGTLRAEAADVFFAQAKSNYSRPMLDEIRLVRDPESGLFRVPSVDETAAWQSAKDQAKDDRDAARIAAMESLLLAALQGASVPLTSRSELFGLVMGTQTVKVAALARLKNAGRVRLVPPTAKGEKARWEACAK